MHYKQKTIVVAVYGFCLACTLKRCVFHVYLLLRCGIGPIRPSSHNSPPGYCHLTGPCDDVTGRMIARTEFSLSYVSPPPPDLPVYGGGGVSVDPAVCYGPGTISMKED